MREILDELERWRESGTACVVARVVDIEGSGPRLPGAAMAVTVDGDVVGSVSGGCVEGAVVERAMEIAKAKGVKRAVLLPVSAPFHCALMQPAADAMAEALAAVTVSAPRVPVMANVLAAPIRDPDEIRKRLVEQVTGTVRWRECVEAMAGAGVTRFVEVGSGKVLTGLLKRIVADAAGQAVGTPDDVAAFTL